MLDILVFLKVSLFNKTVNKNKHSVLANSLTLLGVHMVLDQ